jgi:hypothetical protein
MALKNTEFEDLYWIQVVQWKACERNNELPSCIKCGDFLYELNHYQNIKTDSDPCRYSQKRLY